ncbi:TetR/AcrR family transcriptional regulator [Xanthomonas axonopodis pv. ricini]|uniref:TetR/AcrR family transcriptional regulator n=1 Tax=Xanthomonas euvesicatoria TaxID=456327 RepID=UPI002453E507|nr:TetR/AcrR family transcriptional regulator [Xanthomonas euvesicatoria]MDH4910126.1 TetR/AcrR family transcriptional regulator [Xanthomonas euvesicatoria]
MRRSKSIDRDHVLNVAKDIVMRHGSGELSIGAVAKAAGISKGGVQSCFGTKDGLIAAMLQRWSDAYDDAINALNVSTAGKFRTVQKHIRLTATADTMNAKAASLLAALLQANEQPGWVSDWYSRQFQTFDASTDDGRRARLGFLAAEGAFMLRSLGLVEMSEAQWREVFDDIEGATMPSASALGVSGRGAIS